MLLNTQKSLLCQLVDEASSTVCRCCRKPDLGLNGFTLLGWRGVGGLEKGDIFNYMSAHMTDNQPPFDQAFTLIALLPLSIIIYGRI